jgi:hypothetical protein
MSRKKSADQNQPTEPKKVIVTAISAAENEQYNSQIESADYIDAYKKLVERVLPNIDVRNPKTFVSYGSAEKYYENSFSYIYNSYPYDGSGLEKIQWSLSASAIDLGVLQYEYPKETGYVTFTPEGWGSVDTSSGRYSLPDSVEYIKFSGGPYVGSVFDSSTGRESSLKINPSLGNTLEFWLKKDSFVSSSTQTEVVFDSYTIDFDEGEDKYGRFLLELSGAAGSPFYLTYMSGTNGFDRQQLGEGITDSSVADGKWHHYAFVLSHTGSTLKAEMYLDGAHNATVTSSIASMNPVSGYFNGAIGSLATEKDSTGGLGYGKLSGSVDEVRFWKIKRTAENIGNYFDFPVHGATDKEQINSTLGLYYKFNEGTVSLTATDKVVLDYSGRLNNGEFVGYSSSNRNSGSAITESDSETTLQVELGDPIMNPNSNRVRTALQTLKEIGKDYDDYNNSSIFKTVPQWAYEPSAGSSNPESDFSILLQAVASKFDSIKLLIDSLPTLNQPSYSDSTASPGSVDYKDSFYSMLGCEREFVTERRNVGSVGKYSWQNLLARGFNIEDFPILNQITLNQYITNTGFDQTDPNIVEGSSLSLLESNAEVIKDKILENTYNNLHSIYEKKGTEASFRNLIRCYGVDEKLISPNVYINNGEIILKDDLVSEEVRINSLAAHNDNYQVTIFQTASTSDERYYIAGKDSGSVSYEVKTIFPSTDSSDATYNTTSIFGVNEVNTVSFELASPNNAAFTVGALKSSQTNKGSYFTLSSSAGIFDSITTPYFTGVFDNTVWNFAVRFTEDTAVKLSNVNNKSSKEYKVEFSGYQYEMDILVSSFNLSESISQSDYENFIQANKSVFLGAERSDITGSVITNSENKFLSLSVWDDYLEDSEVMEHAKSADNIGRFLAFHEESDNSGRSHLRADSLALNWQFDNVTTSGSTIEIADHASGSTDDISIYGQIVGYKYPAKSTSLASASDIIKSEALSFMKQVPIDNARAKSRVEIKDREIEYFELDSRPISYIYTYEKSMYQVISREMLRMLAGVSAYNNLIGEPIYKYRQDYKSLEKLRERFFNKVEGDIDLERFIEYYKWLDSSLGKMLQQLQPATAAMKLGLQDVVESHTLERNKYKHQAPVFEFKDPKIEGQILGINELLYDWEHGHAPLLVEEPIYWAAFDGTDDFIDVPDSDDFSFGDTATDSPFSLTAWAVFTSPGSSAQAIMGKYDGNTDSEYLVFNNNGFLQFNIYDQNTTNRIQSKTNSSVFVDGNLYNITVTYDGSGNSSGINIYIDGTLVSQTRSSTGVYTAMHNTTVNFQIGSTVLGTLDFARNMRHVMVFGAELDSSDVTELLSLYDRGKLNVSATTLTKYSDLISWWKLDGTDFGSATATDVIGGHDGTFNGDAEIVLEGNFVFSGRNQAENCLWWKDRAERDGVLAISGGPNEDRQTINTRINTVVSGSTYVVRNLSRPYKIEGQNVKTIQVGSNRNANKNKDLYRIVNSGKEITLDAVDIYEFKQCDDVINPQEEKVYTAKTDVEGTSGYLDADADMIFPFSLYSSSAGNDFSIFKDNLKITNNHDDEIFSLQGPFVREFVGGMPHRRVKFLTADAERAEAYMLSASATTLTLKQSSGPKSIVSRGRPTFLNIANIKTDKDSTPIVVGNYDKVYEIVQTHGRSLNNRLLADSGSIPIDPISAGRVFGTVDYTVPTRPRSEHVFVNRFSAPGGPETMAHGSRDLESGEFSIYNTMNYRNLSVRDPLNRLHSERSEQFGYRSGSTTQASVHMTNRNYLYSVTSGSYGEQKEPDNFYVQHPIPQNDMQYAWITASSDTTALELVEANAGFGHQHNFITSSRSVIQFISSSTYQNPVIESKIVSSDIEDEDYFGFDVSVYGDILLVGASREDDPGTDSGAAYVFERINGVWQQVQKLEPPQHLSDDRHGRSVWYDGNRMIIGAYAQGFAGSYATVYEKVTGSWEVMNTTAAVNGMLTPLSLASNFGRAVQIQGDTAIVGNAALDSGQGGVHVYNYNSDIGYWDVAGQEILTASVGTGGTAMGWSASIYENTIVVGNQMSGSGGAAWIFETTASWDVTTEQKITASDSAAGDNFGHAVRIYEDTIISSADGKDSNKGAVYVFQRDGGTWSETQKLQPTDLTTNDFFGDSVAIYKDTLAVGATGGSTTPKAGSVYLYEKINGTWIQVNKFSPFDVETGDAFGFSLSLHENVLSIGSVYDSGSANDAGSVYVYRRMGKSWADVEVSYAGINLNIVDGLDESTNTLEKTTDATVSQLITHRQGPYGWPTWKQIRGYEHPIARAHKNSNTFSRAFYGTPQTIISGSHDAAMNAGYSRALDRSANVYERARKLDVLGTDNLGTFDKIRVIKNYKDIPVTKRFFPMSLTFHGSEAPTRGTWYTEEEMVWKEGLDSRLPRFFKVRENIQKLDQSTREMAWINDSNYYEHLTKNIILGEDFEIEELSDYASSYGHVGLKKTYQNDVTTFSEMQIMEDALMREDINHEYLPFVNSLVDELATNDSKLLQSSYSEKIYPREINTFTKNARERENFDFFRWKSSVSDRSIILSGNVNHHPDQPLLAEANASAFPKYDSSNQDDYKKSFFGLFDAVDVSSNSGGNIEVVSNISASSWVLDSRSDLTVYPVNITSSYLNDSSSFLATRDQGTRGEGILQNDFSTFPLGYNGLYGAPPFSLVYNRRIPQVSGSDVYLAGEAKWEAATGTLGPFYDSYKDYAFNDIRLMAQDHSIVPEFRISEFVNEILAGDRSYPDGRIEDPLSYWEDYLSITGAVYANSSGDIELGSQFYKSYSNSDFMKYFEVIDNNVISNEQPISHSRITLKCKAAMKFLPYKGFYPADRATEIAELFYKNYLSDNVLTTARVFDDSRNSEEDTRQYLKLRAHCSRYQASKLLFGPGVLMNSIKAGVAVDYPRFSGAIGNVRDRLPETIPLTGSWPTAEDEIFIASGSFFTGSAINNTVDQGIPRLKGPGVKPGARIEFEDMLNPANIYDTTLYDHEPHPSASLIYGSKYWNRIIERSAKFGNFNQNFLPLDLGVEFNNTRESFARQMSPYTMAMQNFAAETVNFFVEDGHLTTAMSKPIDEYFVSGTTYKMNVRLTNVDNVMYDRHSAFGPPVDDSGDGLELRDLSVTGAPAPDAIALTFNDPDDYRTELEASAHSQGDLPGFLIKDMDSQGSTLTPFFDVVFYSSDTQGRTYTDYSSSGYVLIYIDIDDLTTAADVAQEVRSRLQSFSLITQYLDVTSDGSIITMSASYNGPSEIGTSLTQNGTIGIDIFTGSSNPSIFASTVSAFTFSGGVAEDAEYYTESTIATTSSHGYMPFVPPFLDPNADPYVEVSFTPDESRKWSAREIVEASTFEYYNFKEVPNNSDSNNNYIHAMSLSASLNLGIITSLKTDNIETIVSGNGFISDSENPEVIGVQTDIKVDDNKKLDRWVIQTKWETPVLDFTNVKATALNLDTGQEQLVSGSPWKTRYWDQYYTVGKPRSGVTSGSFMTGSIGMWHQKGALIGDDSSTKDKGYFLKIEDVGSEGLASKLGFVNYTENQQSTKGLKRAKEYRTRIGAVEDRKVVKEAVVAIPYVIREDLNNRVDFVTFNQSLFEKARNNFNFIKKELNNVPLSNSITTIEEYREFLIKYQKQTRDYISDSPLNAIEYQLFMMEDYILPPQLDFRITGNDPFMMYFFQFRASLDKTDISNIWQNLYPESYLSSAKGRYSCADRSFQGRVASMKDVSYVSHYLDTVSLVGNNLSPVDTVYDLFSPRNTQDKTRWLVFKVKERGQANLENIRISSIDPRISNVEKLEYIKESKSSLTLETQSKSADAAALRSLATSKLQYNWPYDYFSFVELVKLEAKIDSYNYKK